MPSPRFGDTPGSATPIIGWRRILPTLLSGSLVTITYQNYLLFHTLAERIAVNIAVLTTKEGDLKQKAA